MEYKGILVVLGIVFLVVKSLMKNNDTKKPVTANRPKTKPAGTAGQAKSIDDIFNDFVKEIEKKNAPQKKVAPVVAKKKETLNWQEVDHTKIKAKKQLINHDDYHDISHRIDPIHSIEAIEATEGEVYTFNTDNIDWKQAIIAKEILDRKYA